MRLEESRELLLSAIGEEFFFLLRAPGNLGDELIAAGTAELLRDTEHWATRRGTDVRDLPSGGTLVIAGGGGWTRAWHHSALTLLDAEDRFDRIVVLPSTFDTDDPVVVASVLHTDATLFTREQESQRRLTELGVDSTLTHCPSFFFDFEPYSREPGHGVLNAFRIDPESAGRDIPATNIDISVAPTALAGWLALIESHREVHTDRAHVAIAAALMGKRVVVRPNSYFKVRSMVETWLLSDYDVEMDLG